MQTDCLRRENVETTSYSRSGACSLRPYSDQDQTVKVDHATRMSGH